MAGILKELLPFAEKDAVDKDIYLATNLVIILPLLILLLLLKETTES
jgi:hypothetical protein